MAGDLAAKERAIVTLTTTGASLANGSAAVANATADFDCRSTGNFPDDLQAIFELSTTQWTTVTNVIAGTVVAELYLLPLLDGSNLPDVDLTAGASVLPYASLVGHFVTPKLPVTVTNMRFISRLIDLHPVLYRPYILNRSGQTINANWTLKALSARGQYT